MWNKVAINNSIAKYRHNYEKQAARFIGTLWDENIRLYYNIKLNKIKKAIKTFNLEDKSRIRVGNFH